MKTLTSMPLFKRCVSCVSCFSAFSSPFPDRVECVKCKPTTKAEAKQLLNFEGGKIVQQKGPVTTLIK